MIECIREIDIARSVHYYGGWQVHRGKGCRTAIPAEPLFPGAREPGHVPRRIHFSDSMVVAIRDVEIAGSIVCDIDRTVQIRFTGRATITGSASRNRRDRARGVDSPDAVISLITDVKIAGAIEIHPSGYEERRVRSQPAVS
jgi:hypothetical protein